LKRDRAAVVGHINMDKELYLESFPSPGVSVSVRETQEHLGGCAATIAMTAARLGAEVSLYSVVGPDFPRGYIEELKATGVEMDGMMVLEGPSPYCLILNAPGKEQGYIMFQGVSEKEAVLERSIGLLEAKLLLITSGVPSFHAALAERAVERDAVVIFDPTQEIHYRWGREELRRCVKSSSYIFLNELEYRKMREILREDPFSLSPTLSMIVVTAGERGYRVIERGGERRFPAVKTPGKVITPTGAGDVMRGGFLAGLQKGLDPLLSVRLGAAVAAMAICREQGRERFLGPKDVAGWLGRLLERGGGEALDADLLAALESGKHF